MSNKNIYKIIFYNQGRIYEIYAKHVYHDAMLGFIEIKDLVFGERTSVVVDPTEENLKTEFEGVGKTFVPIHSIIRIDEVKKQGIAKITETSTKEGNITPFPIYTKTSGEGDLQ